MHIKKLLTIIASLALAAVLTLSPVAASACTALYIGSDNTADGSTFLARSEDFAVDYNKLFMINEAGKHKEGELYQGCYGFTWTFTHDSYSYTARRDDNLSGVCPDCDGEHDHQPYEEAGTNEFGVMVSATETLYAKKDVFDEVDPYEDLGIEEAEITTVLLSEAATAKEAVDLLLSIYDGVGANNGSGIIIADPTESYLVENFTGHTYIALKLTNNAIYTQPNVSVIGKIDLDDTENVIASSNLIDVAEQAGAFEGDKEQNVIDFAATFDGIGANSDRLAAGLNYLYGVDTFTPDNIQEDDYCLTNIDMDGNIVPLYSNITLSKEFDADDMINFYKVEPIAKQSNAEIHIFQVLPEAEPETKLIEWCTMDDGRFNVLIPYYPLLTTDTADCYKVSTEPVARLEAQPETGDWYLNSRGYYGLYPEGWKDSYYWSVDALSNALSTRENVDEAKAQVLAELQELQTAIEQEFADVTAEITAAETIEQKQEIATNWQKAKAEQVHAKMIELYEGLPTE